MDKLLADMHTHTLASGHAYGTIRENVQAAAEKGLSMIGITEHAPGIPGTCDPFYYKNLKVLPRKLYGVKILYGSEINVLNGGTLSMEDKLIAKLDFAIAGVHTQCYKDEGPDRNTLNVIECMKHPKIKIISHPDDDHTPLNYSVLVPAAKEYGVALEINNSSLIKKDDRLNCYENYHMMLKLCMKYQVPVMINSDAHDPFYVGEFRRAIDLIEKENFDKNLVLNFDENKVLAHLGIEQGTFDFETGIPPMGI